VTSLLFLPKPQIRTLTSFFSFNSVCSSFTIEAHPPSATHFCQPEFLVFPPSPSLIHNKAFTFFPFYTNIHEVFSQKLAFDPPCLWPLSGLSPFRFALCSLPIPPPPSHFLFQYPQVELCVYRHSEPIGRSEGVFFSCEAPFLSLLAIKVLRFSLGFDLCALCMVHPHF